MAARPCDRLREREREKMEGSGENRSEGPTPALQSLSFVLAIGTTDTAPRRGSLNRFEDPYSEITFLDAGESLTRYDETAEEHIELTRDEQAEPGYVGDTLVLESENTTRQIYNNDKGFFTVAEVVAHIVEFERIDRPKTEWFGGIDCSHVFFEGIRLNSDGDAYRILWGS